MQKIKVLVAGATGYIGTQLVKHLIQHKNVIISYLCGKSSAGKKLSQFDKYFKYKKIPIIKKFDKSFLNNVDVIFTALPNGDAQKISKYLKKKNKLIDLSADFRIENPNEYFKWYKKKHLAKDQIKKSIYSLPEINNKNLKNYSIISCPGCYPTSILLPLIPLIKENLINTKNITIDSKSGYSGAGRQIHMTHKNKNLYESLGVYGVATHRHNSEISQELKKFTGKNVEYNFTPHLIPMFRGILTSIYVDKAKSSNAIKIINNLKKFYKKSKFIKIMKKNTHLSTNSVINTNLCKISVCELQTENKLLIISVIDNLIKGGSGQAIQNFNKIYSFNSSEGLK